MGSHISYLHRKRCGGAQLNRVDQNLGTHHLFFIKLNDIKLSVISQNHVVLFGLETRSGQYYG